MAVGLVALAPMGRAAPAGEEGPDLLPVRGAVLPTGDFVGTLRIVACIVDAAGRLRLTGVLHGTITQRSGARIPVTQQPFSAPATLRDPGQTTDVVLLALAPVVLDSVGFRIKLAPVEVENEALPPGGEELATRLSTP